MSLLMTFFVLLLTFASMERVVFRFRHAAESIRRHFGFLEGQPTMIQIDRVSIPLINMDQMQARELGRAIEDLLSAIESMEVGDYVQVASTEKGIAIRLLDPVLFEPGSDVLRPQAFPILDRIVRIAGVGTADITINGHTDDRPPALARFPTNWHLSTARSISIAQYMIGEGVIPERFTTSGQAEFHPVAPNIDAESRVKNRRVEIFMAFKYLYQPQEVSPFAPWDQAYLRTFDRQEADTAVPLFITN